MAYKSVVISDYNEDEFEKKLGNLLNGKDYFPHTIWV